MNRLLRLLILIKAEIIQRLLSVVDGTKKSEITSIVSTSLFLSALLSRGLSLSLSLLEVPESKELADNSRTLSLSQET